MKKKKIVSLCLVIALVAVASLGTLAYFTDTDSATNTFTVGKVDIELTEPEWDPEEEHTLMPGTTLLKDPTITVQEDSEDCYLFVRLDMTRYVPLLNAFLTDNGYKLTDLQSHSVREEFTSQYLVGFKDANWTVMNAEDILKAADAAETDGNPVHLVVDLGYNVDGGVLTAEDEVVLFTAIQMPETVDSEEARLFWEYADGTPKAENTPVVMDIQAYAIQAANIDDLDAAYEALLEGKNVNPAIPTPTPTT